MLWQVSFVFISLHCPTIYDQYIAAGQLSATLYVAIISGDINVLLYISM